MRFAILLLALIALPANAQETGKSDNGFAGIWVSTPYPVLEAAAKGTIPLKLSVHNANRPPQRVDLAVTDAPVGWRSDFHADGRSVGAVFAAPDQTTDLELRLFPPEAAKAGKYKFLVLAKAGQDVFELPIELTLGAVAPPKISLNPEFPALQGPPDSDFDFKIGLKNDSGRDVLVALEPSTPRGFQIYFTKEFGSQKLTSVPVKAGATENIEAKIKPAEDTKAGSYEVAVRAVTENAQATTTLKLDVTGQANLELTGPGSQVSGRAAAGEETPINLTVDNDGTASARDISLSSSEPSGWKIKFVPEKIAMLDAGGSQEVKAFVTPSPKAIAGDYMITLRANGDGVSDSSEFRITVETSTVWGIVGVIVIAAALIVLVLAMMRFGRR